MYQFGPYRLDTRGQVLWREDERVLLTQKEYEVLYAVVRRCGIPVPTAELMKDVWAEQPFISRNNLDQQIAALRAKLGKDSGKREYLRNAPRKGYFVLDVIAVPERVAVSRPGTKAERFNGLSARVASTREDQETPASEAERAIESQAQNLQVPTPPPRTIAWPIGCPRDSVVAILKRKQIALPLIGIALAAVALAIFIFPHKEPRVTQLSAAVLPFSAYPDSPDTNALANLVSEMMRTEVGAARGLRVVSGEEVARRRKSLSFC